LSSWTKAIKRIRKGNLTKSQWWPWINLIMEEQEQNNNQLNIELTEDIAEGIYSNLAIITHSHTEFVVDFIRVMPGVPKAKVKSRIVLTPEHAKRLMKAFQDNIAKYEAMNGKIDTHEEPPFPMNFGGPTAQA
jgi:hypothetical protein